MTVLSLERLEARDLPDVSLTPGWATFGHAPPQGEVTGYLQVGTLETQTDVKTAWPDGSIKFAVVTVFVAAAGTYPVTQGLPPTQGPFVPPVTDHAVSLSNGETDWWANSAAPVESTWLSGYLSVETRKVVVPRNSQNLLHPFMKVVLDERFYRDGSKRLDVTVENSRHSAGTVSWYVPSIYADGIQMWNHGWTVHPYLTRWRQTVSFGAIADVTPDFAPAVAAKAVPNYWTGVANLVSWFDPSDPNFAILGRGSLNPFMPDHGGRPELAPLPDWTARYLVHHNPAQKAWVLKHGDLAGSWPVHVREDHFGLVTIDARPNYWLDPRANPQDRPQGDLGQRGPLVPDNAHQPSLAFVPYLMTGDRYYADEMAHWANYSLLVTFQDTFYRCRGGAQGLLWCNETRGIGWTLRNLVHAASYLPDADPLKAHFADKVRNNLTAFDTFAATQASAYGVAWHGVHAWDDGYDVVTLWGHEFVAWAIQVADQQGFSGGTRWRDQIGQFQVGFCVSEFRDGCAPYRLRLWQSGGGPWLMTYADAYQGPTAFQGYYGPDARLMAVLGLELGWAGAREACDFLDDWLLYQPYLGGLSDLGRRAGWALLPN